MPACLHSHRPYGYTIFLQIASVAFSCLAGCQGGVSAPLHVGAREITFSGQSASGRSLYPTAQGLTWHYATRAIRDGIPGNETPMEMAVLSVAETKGLREAVLRRRYRDLQLPETRVQTTPREISLSRLADPPPPGGPFLKILKFPIKADQSWAGRQLPLGNSETVSIVGWESIRVPAGSFSALHVRHTLQYANGGNDSLDYWYTEGLGCAKMVETITILIGGLPKKLVAEGLLRRMEKGGPVVTADKRPPGTPRFGGTLNWLPLEAFNAEGQSR